MEIKEIQYKKTEVITDILCDCCGQSCKVQEDVIENPTRLDHLEPFYNFEYMVLETYWGFYSGKDGEKWSAQICENCVDKLFSFVKFKKENYLRF